ncbi:MAG: Rab family GTPase [Candidatus Hodarchaeota archaeon]
MTSEAAKQFDSSIQAKILLCGNYAVGKTSLVIRYVDNAFVESTMSTIGANFLRKLVEVPENDNKTALVNLQIWDLGGTVREAKTISQAFIIGAKAVLYVCDLTRPETLEAIPSWHQSVEEVAPNCISVLVGNKADLEAKRRTSTENMQAVADEIGARAIFETSAKSGNYVEEAFYKIATSLYSEFKRVFYREKP